MVYSIDGVVPVIEPGAFVHPTAVLIGDVIVAAGCYVGPGASLRGDFSRILVGAGANVQDNCVVHGFPGGEVVIGEDGHIGHGATLHGCTVERNALVGMGAVVMDGAVVGEDSFVAAMAFVKAGFRVPAATLVAGIPARVVRPLGADERAWKVQATREYQALARRSLRSLAAAEPLPAPEPGRPALGVEAFHPLHRSKGR